MPSHYKESANKRREYRQSRDEVETPHIKRRKVIKRSDKPFVLERKLREGLKLEVWESERDRDWQWNSRYRTLRALEQARANHVSKEGPYHNRYIYRGVEEVWE